MSVALLGAGQDLTFALWCRLTVTDRDGLSAEAYATVLVQPEPYYPPIASAGKDQLLLLPNDHVVLNGSSSKVFKV